MHPHGPFRFMRNHIPLPNLANPVTVTPSSVAVKHQTMRKAKTFFPEYEKEIFFKYSDETVCLETPFYVLEPTDLKT